MEFIGQHFNRKVYWLDYGMLQADQLPNKDWVCLAIANSNPDRKAFEEFTRTTISKEIAEFKAHGTYGESLHHLFDITMVAMEVLENHPECDVMTTWHNNQTLADAFWQCFFATCLPDSTDYDNVKVVCIDLDGVDRKNELKDYLEKFAQGWIPEKE